MTTLHISLPEELKRRFFEETFPDENRSALIARLIDEAIRRAGRERASREQAERILPRRASAPPVTEREFRRLHEQRRR